MAATGPTGPTNAQQNPAQHKALRANAAQNHTAQTPNQHHESTDKTSANTGTTPRSELAQVVNTSMQSSKSGQTQYLLTLQLTHRQVQVLTTQQHTIGDTVTVKPNAQGQLQIQPNTATNASAPAPTQQLLKSQLRTLNPGPIPSPTQISSTLAQLILQLQAQAHQKLSNPLAATIQTQRQHLQPLLEILSHLKALEIPINQLNSTTVRAHITQSGLFLENQLRQQADDRALAPVDRSRSAPSDKPITAPNLDLKSSLLKLVSHVRQLINIYGTADKTTSAPTSASTTNALSGIPLITQGLLEKNNLAASQKPLTDTAQLAAKLLSTTGTTSLSLNAALTTLMRNAIHPEASAQTQQSLTQAIALSILFTYLSKLSPTPMQATTNTPSNLQDGWSTLFTALFGAPRRMPRETKGHLKPTNGVPLNTILQNLLMAAQSNINLIQTKQLWLLNQKETPGEFKTLLALELPIQLPTQIHQTPLRVSLKQASKRNEITAAEKVWKINLGFDLDTLGLIKAIGIFSAGNLALTFQTQTCNAQTIIAQHIDDLARPLAQWGIQIQSVQYAAYEPDDQRSGNDLGILQKIVDIEL